MPKQALNDDLQGPGAYIGILDSLGDSLYLGYPKKHMAVKLLEMMMIMGLPGVLYDVLYCLDML